MAASVNTRLGDLGSFPCYFGLLFALSMIDLDDLAAGAQFPELLALTGTRSPAQLADRFGHDLASRDFWSRGAAEIARRVAEFTTMAPGNLEPAMEMAGVA